MEYFLCMMETSFTETESNTVDRIISRLAEQNSFQYKSEPLKLRNENGPGYLKKYKIEWPHKDRHLEEDEMVTSYISEEDEAIFMAACRSKAERRIFRRCIFGYRYSSPARLEMLTFKKPAEHLIREKAEKRKCLQKKSLAEMVEKAKREYRYQKQRETIAA